MGKTQNDIQPLVEKFRFILKSLDDHYLCVKRIGETLACGKNDEFHEWMKLVEALLGVSKPSRSCSALTWAILCRVQFASLFDMCSAQRVPEPDPLPGISFDTRPDPIHF